MKPTKSALGATALLAVAMLLLPAKVGRAAAPEGFETLVLDGTNSIGDASIRTPNYFGITPTQGNHMLLLTTISTVGAHDPGPNQSGTNATTVAGVAGFLGISSSNIRDGAATGTEGSAFSLSLGFLPVGAVITFDYNFLTNDFSPGGHNDFAFYTLGAAGNTPIIADELSPAQFATTGVGNPFGLETHFQTKTITITTAGTYTLGLGVMDATTFDTESALLVDNIAVVIPEPSTIGLGIAGAVLLVALRKGFKKA
jgi:hypothetical protein